MTSRGSEDRGRRTPKSSEGKHDRGARTLKDLIEETAVRREDAQ